jgi:hypothetical protein
MLASAAPCLAADVEGADDAYWQTHSLVFAALTGTSTPPVNAQPTEITLRPKLRLSGTLDPGKLPEFKAKVDSANFGESFKIPAVGSMVLVLVVHDENGYSVPTTKPKFMPGDHWPIVEVKDFTDPRVLDTLKAVQELRKKPPAPKE